MTESEDKEKKMQNESKNYGLQRHGIKRETWKETDINAPMTKSAENQKSNRK